MRPYDADESRTSHALRGRLHLSTTSKRRATTSSWPPTARRGCVQIDERQPDLVLLDWMLPKRVRASRCARRLRATGSTTRNLPIIMLTARARRDATASAGSTPAPTTIMTKPFSMTELIARIRAVLRRIRPGLADDVVAAGDIHPWTGVAHRVTRARHGGASGPDRVPPAGSLHAATRAGCSAASSCWTPSGARDVYVEARTVDVHVGRLRKALNVEGGGDHRSAPCGRRGIRWTWVDRPSVSPPSWFDGPPSGCSTMVGPLAIGRR